MYNPPQKLKFKKLHKIKRDHNSYERRSNLLKFGSVGIQAMEYGKLNACQIEALRIFFRRAFSKPAEVKINVFPGMSLTKKPVSARMGKGKGKPNTWVGHVFKGKVLFEITQLKTVPWSPQVAYIMAQALYKLPVKARVIFLKY